jgi:hypothetical protein
MLSTFQKLKKEIDSRELFERKGFGRTYSYTTTTIYTGRRSKSGDVIYYLYG